MVSGRRTRKAASTVRPPGMYRAAEHRADDSAMGEVDRIFTDKLGWMFTRNQVREYGIDGHTLVVRGDGLVTGRMLATQVKGGASRFRRATAGGSGWTFWSDNDHLHYWLGYHVPVLVVLVRPGDGAAFWLVIRPSTVTEHAKGFTMVIPSSQRLDASADEQLLAIAVNERGLLESFPAHCAVLPPSAVRVLERARDADPFPAARLWRSGRCARRGRRGWRTPRPRRICGWPPAGTPTSTAAPWRPPRHSHWAPTSRARGRRACTRWRVWPSCPGTGPELAPIWRRRSCSGTNIRSNSRCPTVTGRRRRSPPRCRPRLLIS